MAKAMATTASKKASRINLLSPAGQVQLIKCNAFSGHGLEFYDTGRQDVLCIRKRNLFV
jgi:hypothetical protein